MQKTGTADEIDRIRRAYAARTVNIPANRYSFFDEAALFAYQSRERALLSLLKYNGLEQLGNARILDVGCGNGEVLRSFIRYGADPRRLSGIDLLPDRIENAQRLAPAVDFRCGSADQLPFESGSFDIVCQFTAFTSIFSRAVKRSIAEEMLRVLSRRGMIIWFDFRVNNPRNADVRGIKQSEIKTLFPDCGIQIRRVLLAPPLARLIAPRSLVICYLLEKLPWLRTHYLGAIHKSERSPVD